MANGPDIFIDGKKRRNRALDGDTVAIEVIAPFFSFFSFFFFFLFLFFSKL